MSRIFEDRKFGLGFIIATQYLSIPEQVLDGVLGNVGSLVVLLVNEEDARRLVKHFPGFLVADLTHRQTLHAAVHTTAMGSPVQFTMSNPIPMPGTPGKSERFLSLSDERDGVPKERVDDTSLGYSDWCRKGAERNVKQVLNKPWIKHYDSEVPENKYPLFHHQILRNTTSLPHAQAICKPGKGLRIRFNDAKRIANALIEQG